MYIKGIRYLRKCSQIEKLHNSLNEKLSNERTTLKYPLVQDLITVVAELNCRSIWRNHAQYIYILITHQ